MKRKLTITIAMLLGAFHLMSSSVLANIIRVEKGGGGNYTTIQKAINAAVPGDTIKVGIGVYYENIVINKSVELIGAGATNWIPQPPSTGIRVIRPDEVLISKYPLKPILPDPPPEIIPIFTEKILSGPLMFRDGLELLSPESAS